MGYTVNYRGHFRDGQHIHKDYFKEIIVISEHTYNSYARITGKEDYFAVSTGIQCSECGESIFIQFDKDKNEYFCTTECKYPKGYPPFKTQLKVPSGYIVAGNDFRKEFKDGSGVPPFSVSCNNNPGLFELTKFYESIELAHSFVGNTCPSIYKVNESKFIIGSINEEKSEETYIENFGMIITDLWWVSMCDYYMFVQYFNREPQIDDREYKIECEPGTYELTHYYHTNENLDIFTTVKKIGE